MGFDAEFKAKYGVTKSTLPEYDVWRGIKQRCTNPNRASFKDYGGRGIRMSEEWTHSFNQFFEDMGRRPTPNHTVERIDNDGDYSKENCVWLPRKLQGENTSRNRVLTFKGETKPLSVWCKELGLNYWTCRNRLDAGKSPEEVLTSEPTRWGRLLAYRGEKKTLMQWCEDLDLNLSRTYYRLHYGGWEVADAFERPTERPTKANRLIKENNNGRI